MEIIRMLLALALMVLIRLISEYLFDYISGKVRAKAYAKQQRVSYTLELGKERGSVNMLFSWQREPAATPKGRIYTYNNREYTDVGSLWSEETERLSGSLSLGKDVYGSGVLKRYTSIPTFDVHDRMWDSRIVEYLIFDGKRVHLVYVHGGYQIASLYVYENLISADSALKPYFKKLGWPTYRIKWIEPPKADG